MPRSEETSTGIYLDLDQVYYDEITANGIYFDEDQSSGEVDSDGNGVYMMLPLGPLLARPTGLSVTQIIR